MFNGGNVAAALLRFLLPCLGIFCLPASVCAAPSVYLVRMNGGADVEVGGTVVMSWVVQGVASSCLAWSVPPLPGWNSGDLSVTGGTVSFIANQAGTYTLNLRCYDNTSQGNTASFLLRVGGEAAGLYPFEISKRFHGQTFVCINATNIALNWQRTMSRWNLAFVCTSDNSLTTYVCPVQRLEYGVAPTIFGNRKIFADCDWVGPPLFVDGFECPRGQTCVSPGAGIDARVFHDGFE